MKTRWLLVGLTLLISFSRVQAAPWQFRWHKGEVLTYRVEHQTAVTEVLGGKRSVTASRLNLVKRWEVQEVDAQGVATVRLSIASMRHEQKLSNGDVLLFDSNNPTSSTPDFRKQMENYIGKVLAVIRVDPYGRVVEVIKGSAAQYESDPPFVVRLPSQEPMAGQAWERLYQITLAPPFGTGEKYQGAQKFQVARVAGGQAVISLSTQIKNMPENIADRMPLLQKIPDGEIVFNIATGRLQSARLTIDKELTNQQGENSSYRYQSNYSEMLINQ